MMEQKFIDIATELQLKDIFLTRYQVRDFYVEFREAAAKKLKVSLPDDKYSPIIETITDNAFMELAYRFSAKIEHDMLYGTGDTKQIPVGLLQ